MFWKHTAVVIACTLPFVLGGCDDESEPGYEPAQPTRGMVELAVNITGTTDLDRDGVVVRFAGRLKEMNSQEMWVFGWEEGEYEAQVSGVKANCAVQGGATHALSVVAGETRSLTIEIVCEPLGPAQIEFFATTANIVKISDRDTNFETGQLEVGCWEDALTGPLGLRLLGIPVRRHRGGHGRPSGQVRHARRVSDVLATQRTQWWLRGNALRRG